MTTQVQIRGAVQATQEARTLAARELDVNTTDGRLCVHNGSTAGGIRHVNYKDQQNQEFIYATSSGTNTITMSCAVAPAAYQAGQRFVFKAGGTNTGAATLNVNSLGAKTIKKVSSGSLTDVAAGDITSGIMYECIYDGTYMQIQGTAGSAGTAGGGADIVYSATASSDATLGSTGIFSSGNSYEIEFTNFTPDINTTNLYVRLHDGTSYLNSTGDYDYSGRYITTATGADDSEQLSDDRIQLNFNGGPGFGSALDEAMSGTLWLHNPAVGGELVKFTWVITYQNTNGTITTTYGGGQVASSTTAITGFQVLFSSGNIESGTITVREKPLS